jgi:hypothetical protein
MILLIRFSFTRGSFTSHGDLLLHMGIVYFTRGSFTSQGDLLLHMGIFYFTWGSFTSHGDLLLHKGIFYFLGRCFSPLSLQHLLLDFTVFNLILYLFNEDCQQPMATNGFPKKLYSIYE